MSQAALVPKLRFSEFSDDWEEKRFVDITTKISDGIHSTPNYDEGGTYSFVNGNNLVNGVIKINSQTKKVDENEYTTHQRPLGSNTILISINGTIGNLALYNNEKVVLGKSACYLNINEKDTDKLYVFNLLRTCKIKRFFNSELTGSTIKNLSLTTIKNTKLNLPTKPEQQKIAAFLTAVDNKIEQLSKKQELLGSWKKGLMQQIFSQATRFKADDDSEFPDWEERVLGDYLAHKSKKNKNNEVDLVLSVSNKKGFITQDEQFDGYQVASKDLTNYKIVEKGEYAYNPSRINVGSIARLKNNTIGIVSPMYVVFKLKNLDSIFFDNLYQTHLFKHLIKVGCSGSVRDSLNFNDMADFVFSFPSLEEQAKIANFLSSIDSKIEQVGKQLDESKQFKKALLQQMFI